MPILSLKNLKMILFSRHKDNRLNQSWTERKEIKSSDVSAAIMDLDEVENLHSAGQSPEFNPPHTFQSTRVHTSLQNEGLCKCA